MIYNLWRCYSYNWEGKTDYPVIFMSSITMHSHYKFCMPCITVFRLWTKTDHKKLQLLNSRGHWWTATGHPLTRRHVVLWSACSTKIGRLSVIIPQLEHQCRAVYCLVFTLKWYILSKWCWYLNDTLADLNSYLKKKILNRCYNWQNLMCKSHPKGRENESFFMLCSRTLKVRDVGLPNWRYW